MPFSLRLLPEHRALRTAKPAFSIRFEKAGFRRLTSIRAKRSVLRSKGYPITASVMAEPRESRQRVDAGSRNFLQANLAFPRIP
jgi:hypothetical protein